MKPALALATALAVLSLAAITAPAEPSHGLSIYGPAGLKLGPEDPFPYVNPAAPKGGQLVMHSGNFTTLNGFALKGIGAPLVDLIFETPTAQSYADNEPFSTYGHLVESLDLAEDYLSMVCRLRPQARFSDGRPVTADDFVFSFEIMAHPEYSPLYRQYFADIARIEKLDEHTVRYHFKSRNQELPLIAGQMPILPRHIYGAPGKDFGKDFDAVAVGSGPYVIEAYEFGKYITVRRNPEWWGRDLPRTRGMYNFDRITARVYLDDTSAKEALKGGEFDVFYVSVAKDWALDFKGPFIQRNYILRREIRHSRPVSMQGFVFNLRRPIFQSLKTRYALAMVYDFPWANANLFYNQYTRTRCFFENSPDMTNTDPPAGRMLEFLGDLRTRHGAAAVPKMALEKTLRAPGQDEPPEKNLKDAEILLESVGWRRGPDGIRVRDGQRLAFSLLLGEPTWERIAEPYQSRLRSLGVEMTVETLQPAEFQNRLQRFDFDMMVTVFSHSNSIGNEQLYLFGSEAADTEGSRNFNGLKNPAVDEVLQSLVQARTRADLVFYGQALDRLLMANCLVVPHWHITRDRLLVWNKFGQPAVHCAQLLPDSVVRDFWWYDPERVAALEKARAASAPLPAP